MRGTLQPLGAAWQPLFQRALAVLAGQGIEPGQLWPEPVRQRASLERLQRLLDLVVVWNQRIDLTGARDAAELVDLYLSDAFVLAARAVQGGQQSWIDVGSGAGAPGLVLELLHPEIALTLVEPRGKRVAFLRTAQGTLALRSGVRECRSDALPEACADVAVSRATFAPETWLAEGARLARQRVWVLLARGAVPSLAGWQPAESVDYRWPLTGVSRRAVCFVRTLASDL
jgi:16S rRNA (guanine527-N7)-methyltransferase